MPGWSSWVLSDQAAIDTCAEDLFAAGWATSVSRGKDTAGNDLRKIQIHSPTDPAEPSNAVLGQAVVLMGSLLLVMSLEDYEASPFYEAV